MEKRRAPLQVKFQEAMKRREQVMDGVIAVDSEIQDLYEEACQVLGSSQNAIPHAGLSLLDKSAGQGHWEFLKTWYRQQGIMKE